jgi:hypothetical protein
MFAELSYYGLLKEQDAQCLRTDVKVEPPFYVLFVGTILLATLNTIVMTAVAQYFRDQETKTLVGGGTNTNAVVSDLNDLTYYETGNGETSAESIRPVPVQFSDRFRWLLCREDTKLGPRSNTHDGPVLNERPGYEEIQERPIAVQERPEDSYDVASEDSSAILCLKSDSHEESISHV